MNIDVREADRICGFMHPHLLYYFAKLASRVAKDGSCAEIGCWRGRTTRAIADHCLGTVYAVDTFRGSRGLEHEHAFMMAHTSDPDWLRHEFDRNLAGKTNVKVLAMSSIDAAERIPDMSLDFVLIDAEHDYESVCEDIRAWYPKVRSGGLATGHDFDMPEVRKAVKDSFPGDWDFPPETGVWEVHKP